ncbi:hypothetical protein U1Q18_026277 [Sarracenia purpurea var. burkii]
MVDACVTVLIGFPKITWLGVTYSTSGLPILLCEMKIYSCLWLRYYKEDNADCRELGSHFENSMSLCPNALRAIKSSENLEDRERWTYSTALNALGARTFFASQGFRESYFHQHLV